MINSEENTLDDIEEEAGFVEDMPEDFYAAEELIYGKYSKCRGKRRKKKMYDKILEELEKQAKHHQT